MCRCDIGRKVAHRGVDNCINDLVHCCNGNGRQYRVVVIALTGLVILWIFPKLEERIYNVRERRTYEMVSEINRDRLKELEGIFQECGLRVQGQKLVKKDHEMVCIIDAYGPPKNHEQVMEKLLVETDVKEFWY